MVFRQRFTELPNSPHVTTKPRRWRTAPPLAFSTRPLRASPAPGNRCGTNRKGDQRMPAYIVLIKEREHDAAEMATYRRRANETFTGYSVKPLAANGAIETLEGPEAAGCVIAEFSSLDEARAWYRSDAYQEARKHRFAGADYRVFITEGL